MNSIEAQKLARKSVTKLIDQEIGFWERSILENRDESKLKEIYIVIKELKKIRKGVISPMG